ncbi:hypothetical protein R5W24_001090 [Gemmata sp. JC717]|uniref:hypothetical protein n=1 Tax=Gemmata algarum TaxID=2975278 RepID=UPI0021BA9070|nr:hypothetical protein [Gemmata algarum]MDY3552010.1 hypothetical protein [Gemmata algarum]
MALDSRTRLYRVCDPSEPIGPDDPRHVNFDEVRGNNVVAELADSIQLAGDKIAKPYLFPGHRGVGKTSELLRLKKLLEKGSFHVVMFDVQDALDVNDLDFPDLMVCIAAEIQGQLKAASISGFSATTTLLRRWWDELLGFLGSEVTIKKDIELDAGFGKLALELKNRPNARAMLREKIESRASDLLAAVNDLLGTASLALQRAGRAGLVVLIDGLDKLVFRHLPNGTNTHDRLFHDRCEQMAELKAHIVYTVPISMIYSPRCSQIEQTFAAFHRTVAMIRVRGENKAPVTPQTLGMQKLWEMVQCRCKNAEVDIGAAFDAEGTCHYLCEMSGGHPRHLLMFLQSALAKVRALPITRTAAEQAVRDYRNALQREVPTDFFPELEKFRQPQFDIPKDEKHQQMMFYLHVFEYMNDRQWYEVNPVLRELLPPVVS